MREDWTEAKIGEILLIERGGSPRPIKEFITKESSGINWIKIGDTKKGSKYITSTEEKIKVEGLKKTRIVEPGDFILSNSMSFGRPFIMGIKGAIHDGWLALRNSNSIFDTDFLYYSLSSPNVYSQFDKLATGSTVRNLNSELVAKVVVSVPPLPEQRAIVKKLESLFSSSDAGVADLKKAQQQLKIYRQAVLKKAFEGDFTKEEIEYKTIGEIGKVKGGKRLPKGHNYVEHSPYPYLRVTDFNNLTIDTSNLKYISKETHQLISRYTISKDDVFISIAGTIGQVGIIPDHLENANLTENAAKITELKDVNNKYLAYYLSSSLAKNQITEKTMATTQPKLALFRIEKIIFPYYSIIKQHQIVKQIESRLSVCDSIEQNIKESLEKAEGLRQSILKKAFEGNLLTAQELAECKQAEDYEPAGGLLERIKAEQKQPIKPKKKLKA